MEEERTQSEHKDMRGRNLVGCRMRNAELAGVDLSSCDLRGWDCEGTELTGACLDGACLVGGVFREADLSGASLRATNATEGDFRNARMQKCDLTASNLGCALLRNVDLSQAKLESANLHDASLARSRLTGTSLLNANLSMADLSEADLSNADLSGANLCGANLRFANLEGATVARTNFSRADLTQVRGVTEELADAICAGGGKPPVGACSTGFFGRTASSLKSLVVGHGPLAGIMATLAILLTLFCLVIVVWSIVSTLFSSDDETELSHFPGSIPVAQSYLSPGEALPNGDFSDGPSHWVSSDGGKEFPDSRGELRQVTGDCPSPPGCLEMEALTTPSRVHYVREPHLESPLDMPYGPESPIWLYIKPSDRFEVSFSYKGDPTFWIYCLTERGDREVALSEDLTSGTQWEEVSFTVESEDYWRAIALEFTINGEPGTLMMDDVDVAVQQ